MSELAKILDCRSVIGPRGRFLAREVSQMMFSSHDDNLTSPSPIPHDSFIPRLIVFSLCTVSAVLGYGARPEVGLAIIEAIAIFVIVAFAVTHHFVVKKYGLPLVVADCIERVSALIPKSTPVPTIQPLVLARVNNGALPAGQCDKFDRLILRLDDGVSRHTPFLHDLTSNEIVRRSAAFVCYQIAVVPCR